MRRWEVINACIAKYGHKSYLEIGLFEGLCYNNIQCEKKFSVDPKTEKGAKATPTYKMTSDEFFKQNKRTFDCIFIDGLHHAEQVYKDIINSLEILNPGGTILCHDMLPTEEIVQRVPRAQGIWTGDGWKAWFKLRASRNDLSMFVVDTDWGVGVIRTGEQTPATELNVPMQQMTWEMFKLHRERNTMNAISIDKFVGTHS